MKIKLLLIFVSIICIFIHHCVYASEISIDCSNNETKNPTIVRTGLNGVKRISRHSLQIKWSGGSRLFKDTLLEDRENGKMYYYCGYNKKAKVHLIQEEDEFTDTGIIMNSITGEIFEAGSIIILSPDYSKFLAMSFSSGFDGAHWSVIALDGETLWQGVNGIIENDIYIAYFEDVNWSPEGTLQAILKCVAFYGTKQEKKGLVTLKEQDGDYQWLPKIECPSPNVSNTSLSAPPDKGP